MLLYFPRLATGWTVRGSNSGGGEMVLGGICCEDSM